MNNCPNCGIKISADQTICRCGELLRADATHHLQSWETETVFRPKAIVNWRRLTVLALSAVIVTFALMLSWPRMISNWNAGSEPDTDNVSQKSSQPADTQPGDLIETDINNGEVTQAGVFDFAAGDRAPQTAKSKNIVRPTPVANLEQQSARSMDDSYDAELLSDKGNDAAKPSDKNSSADCKPEITDSLRRPSAENSDSKPQPKQSAVNYILGPRGGCFFVTASGSKKYVDHSLCAAATTAAARQD